MFYIRCSQDNIIYSLMDAYSTNAVLKLEKKFFRAECVENIQKIVKGLWYRTGTTAQLVTHRS